MSPLFVYTSSFNAVFLVGQHVCRVCFHQILFYWLYYLFIFSSV